MFTIIYKKTKYVEKSDSIYVRNKRNTSFTKRYEICVCVSVCLLFDIRFAIVRNLAVLFSLVRNKTKSRNKIDMDSNSAKQRLVK